MRAQEFRNWRQALSDEGKAEGVEFEGRVD